MSVFTDAAEKGIRVSIGGGRTVRVNPETPDEVQMVKAFMHGMSFYQSHPSVSMPPMPRCVERAIKAQFSTSHPSYPTADRRFAIF
jgi:hypothetical protein